MQSPKHTETRVVAQGVVLLLFYRTRVWVPAPTSGSLQFCVTLNSVSGKSLCFSLRHVHSYMCVQAHAHTHTHALRENIYNLHTNKRKGLERSLVNVRVSNCLHFCPQAHTLGWCLLSSSWRTGWRLSLSTVCVTNVDPKESKASSYTNGETGFRWLL